MNKVLTVAKREFKAAVMTKAFIISIIVMPVMMGGSVLIQLLFKDVKSLKEKNFVLIDRTKDGLIAKGLELAIKERNENHLNNKETGKQKEPKFNIEIMKPSADDPQAILKQRFELAERVRSQDVFGYLDIGAKALEAPVIDEKYLAAYAATLAAQIGDMGSRDRDKQKASKLPDELTIRYYSNSPTYSDFLDMARLVINQTIQAQRGVQAGLDPMKLMSIVQSVPLTNKDLPRRDKLTGEIIDGKDVNFLVSFFVPFGIVIVMFMVIMVGATPLMQGVVEEKMQRISEVLLASAKPFELMLGKLLGGVAVSLLLGTVYVIGALYGAWQYGFSEYLSPAVVAWFLVYLILAVLMFGSLFVAVGAACTDIKETQSLLMPVMLLATFPMFFLTKIIQEPDGAVATGLSFFPFATPSMMVARVAIPPSTPWWHPVLGIVIVLATTLLCVWIASRIFRVGLLMQGKGASFSEIVKWVVKG